MLYCVIQKCLVSPTVIVREQVVGGWAGEKVNEVSENYFSFSGNSLVMHKKSHPINCFFSEVV